VSAVLDSGDSVAPRRITARPAPRREPPYDDEAPHLRLVGPLDRVLPFDEPWDGRLRDVHPWQEPQPTGRGDLPDPAEWSRRMIIGVLEARSGRRSLHQLAGLLSAGVYGGLSRQLAQGRTQPGDFRIRSVHASEPAAGVAEIAAVIQSGPRVRAVAARLESLDGRWRCVRLQIG
jgi:hypothetical protein